MPAIIPIPALTDNYIWLLLEGGHAAVDAPGARAYHPRNFVPPGD